MFLVGTAIIVKASTAVALAAGFVVFLAGTGLMTRDLRTYVRPVLSVVAVFAVVYIALFAVPGNPENASSVEPALLYHLRMLVRRGLQVLVPLATIFHAFVLGLANDWWPSIGRAAKASFLAAIVLTIFPSVFVAGRYGRSRANLSAVTSTSTTGRWPPPWPPSR